MWYQLSERNEQENEQKSVNQRMTVCDEISFLKQIYVQTVRYWEKTQ